jgi:flagellar motor protein MotB
MHIGLVFAWHWRYYPATFLARSLRRAGCSANLMLLSTVRIARPLHQRVIFCALLSCVVASGCRSNSQNQSAYQWPWQSSTPAAPAPPQVASNPSNGPWSAVSSGSSNGLNDIYRRGDAQNRLAQEQHQAIEDLATWQQRQQQQVEAMSREQQQDRLAELQEQAAIVAAQRQELEKHTELRRRALELDTNNSELHAQLAQTEQQNRLLEDQMQLLRQQLNDAATQLSTALESQRDTEQRILQAQSDSQQQIASAHRDAEQRVSALQASMQRRGSATITANSSLRRDLTPVSIAGLLVRPDGDVIRVEMPADRIFAPGTAALQDSAVTLIDQVAAAVRQNYPQQTIGIEAHTDRAPLQGTKWRNPHQLTAAQAMSVFEQFTGRHQFPTQQLFVLGHGANYPVASNATPAGQQRNRRVEIVIYPETVGQR